MIGLVSMSEIKDLWFDPASSENGSIYACFSLYVSYQEFVRDAF